MHASSGRKRQQPNDIDIGGPKEKILKLSKQTGIAMIILKVHKIYYNDDAI